MDNSVVILIAEDDEGHFSLINRNLQRAGLVNPVVRFSDGQQALDYLYGEGAFAGAGRASPLLVLLDLNMPVLDGYQVLKQMKADESTRRIPVIILTTTDDEREVSHCYDLGCNVYMTKPVDYAEFSEAIRQIGLFLSVVTIPDGEDA